VFRIQDNYCDDMYVNMRLATKLDLPQDRTTVLHFFERVQRGYPEISRFKKFPNGDMTIDGNSNEEQRRWVTLEQHRLSSGQVNPEQVEDVLPFHNLILEQAHYDLGISHTEIEYLEVLFGFDLEFRGNHDKIIAESLFTGNPLTCLLEEPGAKAVDFQPSITASLSDDCRIQGTIDIVTRTNTFQVRTGNYGSDAISVYCVVRQYMDDRPTDPLEKIFANLFEKADNLCTNVVGPKILQSIAETIAAQS
jgi:hypothetical protein